MPIHRACRSRKSSTGTTIVERGACTAVEAGTSLTFIMFAAFNYHDSVILNFVDEAVVSIDSPCPLPRSASQRFRLADSCKRVSVNIVQQLFQPLDQFSILDDSPKTILRRIFYDDVHDCFGKPARLSAFALAVSGECSNSSQSSSHSSSLHSASSVFTK